MGNWNSTTFEYVFHLKTVETDKIILSDVTVPCFLSPASPHGAMDMEIRWFKETDCVCLYKKRQVIEGKNYVNRVSLLPKDLKKGNVSLTLQHFTKSDVGNYTCQVTNGRRTEEITVSIEEQSVLYRYKHMVCKATAGVLVILLVVLAALGAVAAVNVATVTAVAAAIVAKASHVTFLKVNRTWSLEERVKMEGSAVLAETLACLTERVTNIEKNVKNQLAALRMELHDKTRQLQEEVAHKFRKETSSHSHVRRPY